MTLKKLILVALVSILFWKFPVSAAYAKLPETELSWKYVSSNGRALTTYCLFQDSRGIIWVGSSNGLSIYDGIVNHPIPNSKLTGAQIFSIVEYNEYLYLGTNHGLLVLNYKTGEIHDFGNGTPKEIRCLLLVENTLWIGSLYGVYTISLSNEHPANMISGLPHYSTYSIIRDSRGIVYAGTYNGLAKWDSVKNMFTPIDTRPDDHQGPNLFINCLLESSDGKSLYVGCEGNLYRYSIERGNWVNIRNLEGNNIKSLKYIDDSHLLIGTDNGIYDNCLDTIKHYRHDSRQSNTLADNDIWCILTDNDNNIWAGHGRGFSIASHSNTITSLRLSTLTKTGDGNEIFCIHRDHNDFLWLGGTNGLLRISPDFEAKWYRHDKSKGAISHNRIRAIDEDSSEVVWISTDAGLNRYNPLTDAFDVFQVTDSVGMYGSNWVYAFEEDGEYYWIGGFLSGLHRVPKAQFGTKGGTILSDISINADTKSNTNLRHHLKNDLINDVLIDNDGNLWILLFRDDILAHYNSKNDSLTQYNIYEMAGSYPSKIAKDNLGRIWCVFNGGAIIFDEKGESKKIQFSEPTEEEAALAIGAVGNDMWISSQNNLWKVDCQTLEASILPIPQKAYSAIFEDTLTNTVILGGIDEILIVNPVNLTSTNGVKSIQFVMSNVNGTSTIQYNLAERQQLTIPYGGKLSLIISSLDYSPESVHRYMYKLTTERDDTVGGWTVLPEGVNEISLSDLKMGNFEILIKRVGMADSPISIPLTVKAPLFLSWWAIVIYGLIVFGVVYGIIMYFRRRNRIQFQEEERKKSLDSIEKKLTFLSNISHDLKTPLSMILGPVSLLKEKTKDVEDRKTLDAVYNNAVRLNNMIHKTIELRHLEDAEDTMLIVSSFDIVEFCKGVFETFKENHPNKNFIFHTSCGELFIEGDAVKFESVMTNLLSNACKYSEEGATITCGISKQDNLAEIVVSDDGVGIEEIDQPLVFQRMFRAPSTSQLKEGTGLGLYLIKKYLELMKGSINLYSKKGQGTSFIITLPITVKEAPKNNEKVSNQEDDNPKILIVEDNAEISSFISNLLGSEYSILTAENGRSGLAIASSFLPDLVIADEMMPIMSGLEMCKRMKQNPRLASIPIIMLTAKTDNNTETESVKLGIDIFMPKPFEPVLLLGRIKHLLKSRNEIREKMRIQTLTETKPIEAESPAEKLLATIAKTIEENVSDPDLNVELLCEKCGVHQKQLYRTIKKYMDVSPLDYIRRVRLQKAAMLLSQKRFTVSEISYMVGFKTPSYFAKCFQTQFGVKPSQYKSDDDGTDKI